MSFGVSPFLEHGLYVYIIIMHFWCIIAVNTATLGWLIELRFNISLDTK